MEQYLTYKHSGIKWIGEIPEHWNIHKIRYIFQERSQKGYQNEPILSATQKYGVIPQDLYENRVVVVNKGLEGLKLVEVGDFVISLRSFQGGIEYAYYRGIISAAYTILEPSATLNSNYIKYVFKSHIFIELLKTCVTGIREGQNINFELLRNQYLFLPPTTEQSSIVHFLNKQTSKIDEYIKQRQQEIIALNELKQAEIAEVVTKGINPDAPMKDSGIPWVGQIPEHWDSRFLFQVSKEHYISNKNVLHQNLLSLSYGKIVNKDINKTDGLLPANFDTYQVVKDGNLILRLTDLQNDHKSLRVGFVTQEGIITSAYVCLEAFNNMIPKYLYYSLHSFDIKKVFYSMGGGLRQGLNYAELRKLNVIVPPKEEQQQIVEFIESRVAIIEEQISIIKSEIEQMQEYKQCLISDAVTGKIKV
ncbi:MAG: restriction endonuclease subunit S [Dysgonamonadaceae bacterium]|nr:restriction endonuclease subunit S [Bacteroidales bacterium]